MMKSRESMTLRMETSVTRVEIECSVFVIGLSSLPLSDHKKLSFPCHELALRANPKLCCERSRRDLNQR